MTTAEKTGTAPGTSISLAVDGMTCASCVGRVERALAAVPGVASATVNLATERAEIAVADPALRPALVAAVEKAGYHVIADGPVELAIGGMTCASCVGRVERALSAVPGVSRAIVNLASERAYVEGSADPQALVAAVAKAGYTSRLSAGAGSTFAGARSEADNRRAAEYRELRRSLVLAAVLTAPVFLLEMGGHLVPALHHWVARTIGQQTAWLVEFALTTAVLAGPGRRFFRKGLPALLHGAPDMDSLVAVGTLAAWGYSVLATFAPALLPAAAVNVYFEAAATIVTLILLGRLLEARAKGRTADAIRRLVALRPAMASVRRPDGVREIAQTDLVAGDIIEVRPGERLAADGEVIDGESWVDESMLTGEPEPQAKARGSRVTGGTMNGTGAFAFRATEVGDSTVLARIVRMVEAAQGGKLPIQALVDRVTLWFVPAVMGLAALTFGVWLVFGPSPALTHALVNAVAVLIIACPCAMGLATPTSILVGTGRGAELGILFRRGEALQALESVRTVAFDKTGTLTEGNPRLADLVTAPGFDRARVLALVASAESRSEHPLARALVAAARSEGLAVAVASRVEAIPGQGLDAEVEGQRIEIGSARFLAARGRQTAAFEAEAARMSGLGRTPAFVAVDGRTAAILALADPIRPDAASTVRALHAQGLKVAMVTGDSARTAHAIAREIGIDEVVADVLPEGKLDAVRRLRAGGRLAFVGDGINDAPALAEADVGIAVGTGTDVAIEAADVVLMSARLGAVPEALALSRATLRNIRQNLFWAFAYNAALIPLAAGALWPAFGIQLSPAVAAGAMALSSVFVVSNALRLRQFRPVAAGQGGTA